ncbi:MAG: right-handed parallel beta-helix repeat-containing protein, partial [Candidatus Heimdallarchaeota archaeon]
LSVSVIIQSILLVSINLPSAKKGKKDNYNVPTSSLRASSPDREGHALVLSTRRLSISTKESIKRFKLKTDNISTLIIRTCWFDMEKKWRYLIGGIISVIVVTSIVVPLTVHFWPEREILVEHDAEITILNDNDFKKYNFTGDGSENNPYIIENYDIATTKNYAIHISSTSKYFIIRNCQLTANHSAIYIESITYGTAVITQNNCYNHQDSGIYLSDSSGVSIIKNFCNKNAFTGIQVNDCSELIINNNTCNDNVYGIKISYSNVITVSNNTVKNNFYFGIILDHSSHATMTNNTCIDNFYNGIRLESTNNVTICNNTCHDSFYDGICITASKNTLVTNNSCNNSHNGIYVLNSDDLIMINNTFSNMRLEGIRLRTSINASLFDNTFYNCGLSISQNNKEEYFTHTIENNWVNGRILGYFVNISSSTISETIYGQLILINCSDTIISNQEISNTTTSLSLVYCENATLINNNFYSNFLGITLGSCPNSMLKNNTCSNNEEGIIIGSSKSTRLIENTCSNNDGTGISLNYCHNANLTKNTCNNNNHAGIRLSHSRNGTLDENNCNYNGFSGIIISSANDTLVKNNQINNNGRGISLTHSDSGIICYNLFSENTNYAIGLHYETNNNVIHHNSFIDNNLGETSQAEDDWGGNFWFATIILEGNYWSDWSGSGDYEIGGNANAVDPYPLSSPPVT